MLSEFARLAPEINSARMYAGEGSWSLVAAAGAWDGLAVELRSAAASFGWVTSGLIGGSWQGPASAGMMAAAAPYAGWLNAAAAQAEDAAGQARAVVGAFEAARAATVHPAMVAANRAQLVSLVLSNVFGQNAPAIATAEAEYERMWAQDVAAMFGYHAGAAAAVSASTPFTQPLRNVVGVLGVTPTAASGIANLGGRNLGVGNIGDFNVGSANHGSYNIGLGNLGSGNIGFANAGSLPAVGYNIGFGNAGSFNVGFGNTGTANIGFANTGNGNIGIGLTSDNQTGFGGLNSGSGNVGLFNSGSGNVGLFNSGTGNWGFGNSGGHNTGIGNTGSANTGFFNSGIVNTGIGNAGSYNMGNFNPGSYNTGSYNTGNTNTGFFNSGDLDVQLGHRRQRLLLARRQPGPSRLRLHPDHSENPTGSRRGR
ncbi:hypothetical protein AWC15_18200 [Mycobacterium lacus]|uniref:PPE domain-containing protein n=1 Tax=Mycobacterium lacus TaxID=169765 RepID=A0A1X1YDB8_9MYCO|nr:PPE domain-containing protein [Mycobacterium lacus]ORW09108.1 hypothetical protein AWC15_18200 [Mycobacterium lacus]BBX95299.1 hypothetical protein MLAC_05930 [Mycobacterium lacus]